MALDSSFYPAEKSSLRDLILALQQDIAYVSPISDPSLHVGCKFS
jgi:hypothetical protein